MDCIGMISTADAPQLIRLWAGTFGDDERLIGRFLELLPAMGDGLAAYENGTVIGAAYLLDAELSTGEKCGYIYAVAVDEKHRGKGIGAKICRECLRLADQKGMSVVYTLPAEESLYAWYEQRIGAKTALFCTFERVLPSDNDARIQRIGAEEYAAAREEILYGRAHFRFSDAFMRFEEALCSQYGGGMYRCGDGVACGYVDKGVLLVREALGDAADFIPALCAMLGAEYALVRRAAPSGEPYIAATAEIDSTTVCGLTLD